MAFGNIFRWSILWFPFETENCYGNIVLVNISSNKKDMYFNDISIAKKNSIHGPVPHLINFRKQIRVCNVAMLHNVNITIICWWLASLMFSWCKQKKPHKDKTMHRSTANQNQVCRFFLFHFFFLFIISAVIPNVRYDQPRISNTI